MQFRDPAINAYLKWSGSSHRVLYLKEEQRVLPTFSLPDIKQLLSYRPKPANRYQRRLHLLILVLLDTGCRIDEVLSLRAADCDLDICCSQSQARDANSGRFHSHLSYGGTSPDSWLTYIWSNSSLPLATAGSWAGGGCCGT